MSPPPRTVQTLISRVTRYCGAWIRWGENARRARATHYFVTMPSGKQFCHMVEADPGPHGFGSPGFLSVQNEVAKKIREERPK